MIMAVNSSRSQRMGLLEGATDGKYRKARPDTGVVTDLGNQDTLADRGDLHPFYNYGYADQEIPLKKRNIPGL